MLSKCRKCGKLLQIKTDTIGKYVYCSSCGLTTSVKLGIKDFLVIK